MRTEQEKKFPAHVELKPDRNLLDPNFNGYKLSLEKLPTYVVSIKTGVDRAKPTEQQYSLQHVQQFAVHNHIFSDPFNPFVVYIVDKMWTILRGSIDFSTGRLDVISELWRVPKPRPLKEGRFNITMSFPDDNHAVVSDGCETIYILKTGDRKSSEPWNPVNTLTPFKGKITPQCCILDSAKYKIGGDTFIDVLAVRIDDKNEWNEVVEKLPSLSGHLFLTVLEWFTFQGEGVEETKWTLKSQRTLLGHSGTKYAYLEQSGSGIVIASESLFHVVVDTEKPIDWNAFLPKNKPINNDKKVEYVWTQTMEEVKLWFKVPFSINKKDVEVDFKRESISVSYKHRPIFEGPLTKPSKIEGSYWIIETPKSLPENTPNLEMTEDDENCTDSSKYKVLEVVLEKEQEGDVWVEEVVKGNTDGQEVSDPEFLKEIYSRLAHLCSDKWGADTDPSDIYDPRQLEECDEYPADSSCLIRVDRSLQKISHTASLGSHQWLFNVRSAPSQPPAICIRHDVDGIVWMPRLLSLSNPEEGTVAGSSSDQISKNIIWKCEHIGTFSALGYVQASKQQRKFTLCSSDISYVAICDVKKHIYVYRQPAKIETCLRNRKTGEHVTHVAKQLVISLDPAEDILGAYATPSYLYILTPENFHAIRILAEEE